MSSTSSHCSPASRTVSLAQWSSAVDSPKTPLDIPNKSIAYNAPYPRPASNVQSSIAEGNRFLESVFLLFLIAANSLETLSIGLESPTSAGVVPISLTISSDPMYAPTGQQHMNTMQVYYDFEYQSRIKFAVGRIWLGVRSEMKALDEGSTESDQPRLICVERKVG